MTAHGILCSVCAPLLAFCQPALPQAADRLDQVKKLYIASFGNQEGAAALKQRVEATLRHVPGITLVSSAAEADASLAGEAKTWIKGYYSLNPRAGTSPSHGQPIYGGYLSVELKGRNDQVLWSYLATPKFGSEDMAHDLTKLVTKKLKEALPGAGGK